MPALLTALMDKFSRGALIVVLTGYAIYDRPDLPIATQIILAALAVAGCIYLTLNSKVDNAAPKV